MPRKKQITSASILDQKAGDAPEPAHEMFEAPVDPLAQYEPADRHWRQAAKAVQTWQETLGASLDLERTARHIAMLEVVAGLKHEDGM